MANKKKVMKKKTVKKTVKKLQKKIIKKTLKKTTQKSVKKAPKKLIKKTVNKKVIKKSSVKIKKVVTKKATLIKNEKTKNPNLVFTKPTPKIIDYTKAITPLADRLVVRVVKGEKITAGGIIIPNSAASIATGYLKAVVLAVGTGAVSKKGNLTPLDVKVGDSVLFSEYSGTKVTFNSEELHIINETDVMGIVQK